MTPLQYNFILEKYIQLHTKEFNNFLAKKDGRGLFKLILIV